MICSHCNTDKPLNSYYSTAKCCKQCYKRNYQGVEPKLRHIYSDQKKQSVTYSRDKWVKHQLSNPEYIRLYNEWKASGYRRALTPTFYRKDASKAFSFSNLKLEQWQYAVHHLNKRGS